MIPLHRGADNRTTYNLGRWVSFIDLPAEGKRGAHLIVTLPGDVEVELDGVDRETFLGFVAGHGLYIEGAGRAYFLGSGGVEKRPS